MADLKIFWFEDFFRKHISSPEQLYVKQQYHILNKLYFYPAALL